MSRLTLRLPETLHQKLADLAEGEGVSLNQYIVYALTQQVTLFSSIRSISEAGIQAQKPSFNSLLQELGTASSSEIAAALAERDRVAPEQELDSNTVARLQQKIKNAKASS